MIRDLSETLNAMLTQDNLPPELATAKISFDNPVGSFNPSSLTVNAAADGEGVIPMAHLWHAARQEYQKVGQEWTSPVPTAVRAKEA